MTTFSPNRIAVHLAPAAVRAVRNKHPWIYAQAIRKQPDQGNAGDLAVMFDKNRNFVGLGLYDPDSPIRIRVLHHGSQLQIDAAWLLKRMEQSFALRSVLIENPELTGFRLIHGENDGLPGLVLDQYDQTLVMKLDTQAWIPHLPILIELLNASRQPERIVLRLSRSVANSKALLGGLKDGCIILGPPLDTPIIFTENNLRFEVDPVAGQKTGFFLDQRDNREKAGALAKGKDVLNVFAYTGGFSVYAAKGGARCVTSLDLSAPALAAAERNFNMNRDLAEVAHARHQTLCADAFAALADMAAAGRVFDMVILDPPSFASKISDVDKAVCAYERLAGLGLRVLKCGGTLVAASCSTRIPAEIFFQTIQRAASKNRRRLDVFERTAHAIDHPIGFPEGAYLKCLFARAVE